MVKTNNFATCQYPTRLKNLFKKLLQIIFSFLNQGAE